MKWPKNKSVYEFAINYVRRDFRPAPYKSVVLQRFLFIEVCMGKMHSDLPLNSMIF